MQLGLFGLDASDAHGQQLPAPRAQGSDAAGGQPAASPRSPAPRTADADAQPHHAMEARCDDERELNARHHAQAQSIIDGLSDAGRFAFELWLKHRNALNYRGTLRLSLLKQWMRTQGLHTPTVEVLA